MPGAVLDAQETLPYGHRALAHARKECAPGTALGSGTSRKGRTWGQQRMIGHQPRATPQNHGVLGVFLLPNAGIPHFPAMLASKEGGYPLCKLS